MDIFTLALIETDDDYRAAFGVMRELRPKLSDADAFATQARRQGGQGYRLLRPGRMAKSRRWPATASSKT